jgi:hypothetical protein
MSDSALQEIHRLQKIDLTAANKKLLDFVSDELALPFTIESVTLRPSAVSLNSINGTMDTSAGKKFFKTHIEPSSIIGEYYNATLLEEAGYPIIRPIFASTDYGKQFLIYDFFTATSMFDSVRALETGNATNETSLLNAAIASDKLLGDLYIETLRTTEPATHAIQPVHQLFLHRLTGPRYQEFYGGDFELPQNTINFSDLAAREWVVNGVSHGHLHDIIARTKNALQFDTPNTIAAVIGHGDAHAGNVFYLGDNQPLTYFDPAFAGTHSPLLDIIKPWIHDCWLKWLYFPDEIAAQNRVTYTLTDSRIVITYDFQPSALRHAFFDSKIRHTLAPTLRAMIAKNLASENWRDVIHAAAMCCPLLTMNLANRDRFKPDVGLLGLALTTEFGSTKGWFADKLKDIV